LSAVIFIHGSLPLASYFDFVFVGYLGPPEGTCASVLLEESMAIMAGAVYAPKRPIFFKASRRASSVS
ncbi:MAG: hypothetical protein ABW117_10880, partial [Candidatus Sedimenticola sp. 1PA]